VTKVTKIVESLRSGLLFLTLMLAKPGQNEYRKHWLPQCCWGWW